MRAIYKGPYMHLYHAKDSKVRAIYKGLCMHPYHAKVSEVKAIYIGSLSHLKMKTTKSCIFERIRELGTPF